MMTMVKKILGSRLGATTAEYALILALVVVALITTLNSLGEVLNGKLAEIIQKLTGN
ncbi:MAG TPA: Flp family type IVb pilin [Clostridiales bacterium UBA8153]|nr:Flp family type IVb pilin [Clostridiales bacterium UBA8153]